MCIYISLVWKALWSCSRCNKEWRRCLLSGFIIV